MKYLITIGVALLLAPCFGQFHRVFRSTPDSAQVRLNGAPVCTTPCVIKYRWSQAVEGRLVFDVEQIGYERWSDTITSKPTRLDDRELVTLKRSIPVYDIGASSAVVGFDKLIADLQDGTVIGTSNGAEGKSTPIKWEGGVKVGEKGFERKFYEVLSQAGFRTPTGPNPKLFSDGERPQLPRFLVGVQLMDVDVDLRYEDGEHHGSGAVVGKTDLTLEWRVLDRSTGKEVLNRTTSGLARHRQREGYVESDNLTAFEDALLRFLAEGSFVELVRSNTAPIAPSPATNDSAAINFILERPAMVAFKNLGEMIRYADRSCVTIITDGGHGSGVIINKEGWVLSAHHVVDGTNRVEVQFSDGLRLDANILYANVDHDLVLLDIAGSGYRALPIAENDTTGIGEEVVTIGTPADIELGQSVSKGILSGKRKVNDLVYLQTDVAVNPGNSGGPLLNSQGLVIGIIQSKLVGKGIEGLGFAIPMDQVMRSLNITLSGQ